MKKIFVLLCAAASVWACGDKTGSGDVVTVEYPPKVPDAGEIPILAWYSIPGGNYTTDAAYQALSDAGFTLTYTNFRDDNASLKPALDAAEKAGVGVILRCNSIESGSKATRQAIVNQYKDHPALEGWFLWDEPHPGLFDGMAGMKSDITGADDAHYCYANLIPDLGDAVFAQWGVANYNEYLALYVDKLSPPFLSYAYYPIVKNLNGVTELVADQWFPSLEKTSVMAKRFGIPFWSFALSTAHTPLHDPNRPNVVNYDDHFPVPTIAHLRVQMWNNLAYGAQALQYFTYWTPDTWEDSMYWYGDGPMKTDGTKGAAYDVVKQMNGEIRKLNGVFGGCKMKWVRHTGETIPTGTKRLEELPSGVKELSTTEPGATVSLLENQGFTFLVVVSRSIDADITVSMKPSSPNVKRVEKDASITELAADGQYTVTPGDILIFVLDGPK